MARLDALGAAARALPIARAGYLGEGHDRWDPADGLAAEAAAELVARIAR